MALIGFDSGEATRYPTYTGYRTNSLWITVADQPSNWQIYSNTNGTVNMPYIGVSPTNPYSGTTRLITAAFIDSKIVGLRRHFGASYAECYISFMVYFSVMAVRDFFAIWTSAGAQSVRLDTDATGAVKVYAGTGAGTLKATIAAGLTTATWYNIKIHLKTSTNTLEVDVNDAGIVDCSGTAMGDAYYVVLGSMITGGTNWSQSYDCIQFNDTTGSVNNSWPGNPKILTATSPIADDASYDDWTPLSGGDEYAMIDEVSPDLDTTYVYSNATGDTSAFEFGTTTTEPSNVVIVGVCLTCVAKRADVAYLTPVVIRGASYVEVTALKKAVGADYMAPIEWFMETDPITGVAWLMTDLNTTEFGFKHTTS